jgi:lysophospholipase
MSTAPPQPPLDPRFQQPAGWEWHCFTNAKGKQLRFGSVTPDGGKPDAIVVVLQGLSEFGEKYFETARDLLGRNLSVWIMDWQGQGLSQRHMKNPQKRHSLGFEEDIADLHQFINNHVKPAAAKAGAGDVPLVMLAHSMGSNIGLRYLARHPGTFACAALSAPMIGISGLNFAPGWAKLPLTGLFSMVANDAYVFGGGEWTAESRANPGQNIFSNDPVRDKVHNAWCLQDPRLQVGNVTFGWLHAANTSCAILQKPHVMKNVRTPCVIALAGEEKLVNNDIARAAIRHIPNVKILELQSAKHEILMERDENRDQFIRAFEDLLRANNIKFKPPAP